MKPTAELRQMLAGEGPLLVPGAYDGASARAVYGQGHQAVYLTGFGMEASILGMPDIGLASQAEIIGHARRIAAAVPMPVLSDADTGYGGLTDVHRTVREFERAGIAGIHIEDQACLSVAVACPVANWCRRKKWRPDCVPLLRLGTMRIFLLSPVAMQRQRKALML